MKHAGLLYVTLLATLLGCTAAPKVKHARIEGSFPAKDSLTEDDIKRLSGLTYQVPGSRLVIREDLNDLGEPNGQFSVVSLPVEADPTIFAAYPQHGWLKSTRTILGAVYVPNTRFLQSLGVVFADDRKQLLEAVGGITKTALQVGISGSEDPVTTIVKPRFPIIVDTPADLVGIGEAAGTVPLPCRAISVVDGIASAIDSPNCGTVTYGALPFDAVQRDVYLKKFDGKTTSTFPVPACRSASVCLEPWAASVHATPEFNWRPVDGNGVHVRSVVIDARYVRIVRLPASGRVDFHEACGADVVIAENTADSMWAPIAELAAQVQSIKEARNAGTSKRSGQRTGHVCAVPTGQ